MIKGASVGFVLFIVLMFTFGIMTSFLQEWQWLVTGINISAIGLLISGILLIFGLILDRHRDSKEEKKNNDEYKNY